MSLGTVSSWPSELTYDEVETYSEHKSSPSGCIMPWNEMYISSNGDVRNCCYQIHNKPLGNLNEKPWKDIWQGKELNETREMLLNNKVPKICSGAKCIHVLGR